MSQTLKQLLDRAALESGFSPLNQYAGSNLEENRQWLAIANRESRDLMKFTWPRIKGAYSFTLTTATEYDLPSDWQFPLSDTFWSTSQNRKIDLPTTDEYWSYLQSHSGSTGIRYRARIRANKIEIHNPTSGDTVRIEYSLHGPWQTSGGSSQQLASDDSDTFLLDDELFILGCVWRYRKLKQLEYTHDFKVYESYRNAALAQANGAQKVSGVYDEQKPPYEPYTDLWAD